MFHVKHINKYSKTLYKLALKSYKKGEIPVSCIIIYDGKIIGKGYNTRQYKHNLLGHAEINAIISAEKKIGDWRLNNCTMITTLKPCNICNEMIKASRISNVYYVIDQKNAVYDNKFIKIDLFDEYLRKCNELFTKSFKKIR